MHRAIPRIFVWISELKRKSSLVISRSSTGFVPVHFLHGLYLYLKASVCVVICGGAIITIKSALLLHKLNDQKIISNDTFRLPIKASHFSWQARVKSVGQLKNALNSYFYRS